jgi:23S rRNA (adenine2503-C2)-methyltransferase
MPAMLASYTDLTVLQSNHLVESMGGPAYRAKQLRKWVYRNMALSFEEMTDLPLSLRQRLTGEIKLHSLEPLRSLTGKDGTLKMLFRLTDGKTVESVLMFYGGSGAGERRTVCVSTQVGCAIGCPFCATGQQDFERNLTPGEIIDQVLYFAHYLRDKGDGNGRANNIRKAERISNIVFMGMGEPLANYANLWQAIEMLNSPEGFGLGARNIVVSTAGLVPQIKRLAGEKLQVGLAVSLHAAENDLRNKLVPINKKYPLEKLIPACREYSRSTGRRLSFEYILFNGINDSIKQARSLAALLKGLKCHVNLIPTNITDNPSFRPPPRRAILAFESELKKLNINVTLRERRGQDIDAGCGQLRSRYLKKLDENPVKSPGIGKA